MRVTRDEKPVRPIVITLETENEIIYFGAGLGCLTNKYPPINKDLDTEREPGAFYKALFDKYYKVR